MSESDLYLYQVLNKYNVPESHILTQISGITSALSDFYKDSGLLRVNLTGSIRKGTAISVSSDVDLMLSFSSTVKFTLKDIRNNLMTYLHGKGFVPQNKRVAVGINYAGYELDVTPAIRQSQWGNEHAVSVNTPDRVWQKTNIDKHIYIIANSGLQSEIRVMKIWKTRNSVKFPSVYLELLLIEYFKQNLKKTLSENVSSFITYLSTQNWESKVIFDPANSNNKISSLLDAIQKRAVSSAAKNTLPRTWAQAIW